MKRLCCLCFVLAVIVGVVARPAAAQEPVKSGKVRVLLTVGGHGYDVKPFDAMFNGMTGVQWKKVELPKELDLLKPGLQKDYDVIVMYDMCPAVITPQQQKAFISLLKQGIGVVSLHHNMGAHQDWPEFRKIIGGKFFTKPGEIDGVKYAVCPWDHDQDMKVTVVNKEHPITKGLVDFQIHDETYKGYWTDPKAVVLLKTDHPKNSPELAWVTQYGKSRVFYLMLGHDGQAWANPAYRKLLHQGILWAAGK
jgi:type 1 glutamine amidotransferase